MISVDFHDLKQAAVAGGGSLNDAFVASGHRAIRRYHELHGAPVGELRLTMPISIRKEDDPAASNRITLSRFKIPVGVAQPLRAGATHRPAVPICSRRTLCRFRDTRRGHTEPSALGRGREHAQTHRPAGEQCSRVERAALPCRYTVFRVLRVRTDDRLGGERHTVHLLRNVLRGVHDRHRGGARLRRAHGMLP